VVSVGSISFAFIENGLAFVAFIAVTFSLFMSFVLLAPRRGESAYDRIGAGGMTKDSDYDGEVPPVGESAAERAEREREIRQMLVARSERLVRGGQPALDVDAELARLLATSPPEDEGASSRERDPELLAEVRQLVLARNERRARQGEEPLDVEVEIVRTLKELDP
jgi:hypothetical protein